jgi:hypothetical protein
MAIQFVVAGKFSRTLANFIDFSHSHLDYARLRPVRPQTMGHLGIYYYCRGGYCGWMCEFLHMP